MEIRDGHVITFTYRGNYEHCGNVKAEVETDTVEMKQVIERFVDFMVCVGFSEKGLLEVIDIER